MKEQHNEKYDKDAILIAAFKMLEARGIVSTWGKHPSPYTALQAECLALSTEESFIIDLRAYLRTHSIVTRALEMFFTCIAMAARAQWDNVPEHIRPITARGWFIGRWLPTFLIIDGPIGKFICSESSPLYSRCGPNRPILSSAKDFLNERHFKLLRNGFAHWGFDWEVVGNESYVIAYDWERDLPTAKLHQTEADAFHIIAFALIEVLHGTFISKGEGKPPNQAMHTDGPAAHR
jgi:hypothetical protein